MPVAYPSGTVAEHRACRADAVAFDVSHLGTVRVTGPDAFEQLQHALSNDLRRVHPGRAQYTHLLDEDGTVVDDLIVWWVDEVRFDVMPNASNTSDVLAALGGQDVTAERAVVAIQGPDARARLSKIAPEAAAVHRFCVERFEWHGAPCFVAGTGYTGEDGVECAVPADVATEFWEAVLVAGDRARRVSGPATRCGSRPGCLCTGTSWVRASRRSSPAWAGWSGGTNRSSPDGPPWRRNGRRARPGASAASSPMGANPCATGPTIHHGADHVGILTSGNFSPMRECGIGLGFVDADAQLLDGDPISVVQRGRELSAVLVRPPLWPIREESE